MNGIVTQKRSRKKWCENFLVPSGGGLNQEFSSKIWSAIRAKMEITRPRTRILLGDATTTLIRLQVHNRRCIRPSEAPTARLTAPLVRRKKRTRSNYSFCACKIPNWQKNQKSQKKKVWVRRDGACNWRINRRRACVSSRGLIRLIRVGVHVKWMRMHIQPHFLHSQPPHGEQTTSVVPTHTQTLVSRPTPTYGGPAFLMCMHAPSCGRRTRRPERAPARRRPPPGGHPRPRNPAHRPDAANCDELRGMIVSISPLSSMQLVQPRGGCRIFIHCERRWACESHLGNILLVALGRTGGWHEVLHRQIIVLVGFSRTRARRLGSWRWFSVVAFSTYFLVFLSVRLAILCDVRHFNTLHCSLIIWSGS